MQYLEKTFYKWEGWGLNGGMPNKKLGGDVEKMKRIGICLVLPVIVLAIMTSIVSADNGGSANIVVNRGAGADLVERSLKTAGFTVNMYSDRTAEQMLGDIGRGHEEGKIHIFFYLGDGNREAIAGTDKPVTDEQLKDALECDKSTTILILDSCQSGGAAQKAANACCTILTSTHADEMGLPTPFTNKLGLALSGEADTDPDCGNEDKKVTLGEVHKYLSKWYDTENLHHVYNGDTKNTEDVVLSRITNFKLISPAEQIIEPAETASFKFELKNNFDFEKTVEISAIWKQVKEKGIVKLTPQWWGATIDGHVIPDNGVSFDVVLEANEIKEIEMVVTSSAAHEPGDFAKIEVSDPDGTITTSILTTTTIIPEFATIAIPAVTILGLVFLMSRRSRHNRRNN